MGDDFSQQALEGGTTGGAAKTGSGPAAAGRSAAADRSGAAAADQSTASTSLTLRERVKRLAWWAKLFGVLGILGAIVATVLVITGTTDIGVAGYIVSAVGLVIAAVPMFSG